MSERLPISTEPVAFRQKQKLLGTPGQIELFKDRLVLKSSSKFSWLHMVVNSPPPTFPPSETNETIQFTNIASIIEVAGTGIFSRSALLELRTSAGVVWEIKGEAGVYRALKNAYQAWKDSKPE